MLLTVSLINVTSRALVKLFKKLFSIQDKSHCEKSRVKNFFAIVVRAVAKVYYVKKFWGLLAL